MTTFLWSSIAALAVSVTAKSCTNMTVPISISSRNGVFDNFAVPQTDMDATTFVQNITRQGGNATEEALTGYATVSGNYKISAQFCTPSASNASQSSSVVQILSHGIGFDKTYWDLPYNNFEYSYLDVATDSYGYNTFSYDRLGIGDSSHGDPRNEIQAFLEVAALAQLTNMLRNGSVPNINKSFSKVVHLGHSFGSAQSYALTAMYPNISDGIVLTGFSMNSSFVSDFAAGAGFQQANSNQQRLAAYPNGYLANANVDNLQYLFLLPPFFDEGIAQFGEAGKQPAAIGELLTLGSLPTMSTFAGPVLVFTGSGDLPFCGGDCLATGDGTSNIPSAVKNNFPGAKTVDPYIQPDTGHGLAFHYNATAGYRVINDWLGAQGLSA